jgi:hypothetical protein
MCNSSEGKKEEEDELLCRESLEEMAGRSDPFWRAVTTFLYECVVL